MLGVSLLLVMALGPLIVQVDSSLFERKHERQAQVSDYPATADRVSVRQ